MLQHMHAAKQCWRTAGNAQGRHSYLAKAVRSRRCCHQTVAVRCQAEGTSAGPTQGPSQTAAAPLAEVPSTQLQQQLDQAVEAEDYQKAAALRDALNARRADARCAVEDANLAFYTAFESGDMKAMEDIWGHGPHIQCIHPRLPCIAGRDKVMESWELILQSSRITITLQDVRVYVGETEAFVTCLEIVDAGDSRGQVAATNVFELQDGRWKIVHHQGGPC